MGWGDVNQAKGGSQDEIQLTPNTARTVHVLLKPGEEPLSFWTHYIPSKVAGKKGRVVICPGKDQCPACAAGAYQTRRRHAINVYDYETRAVKILEQGAKVFQQLRMIFEQYGSFDTIDVSIKRVGDRRDNTDYIVIPIPRAEPFDKELIKHGVFPLEAHKAPFSPEQIETIIAQMEGKDGAVGPEPKPSQPQMGKQPPAGQECVLTFGKYQGRALIDVANEDLNYVKWCAENVADPKVKTAAQEIYDLFKKDKQPEQAPAEQQVATQPVLTQVYDIINNDPRYKGNFTLVVNKMKEATQSPQHPNGKTLLTEYTPEELEKFLSIIR